MFQSAIDYLTAYRKARLDSLQNVKPMRWFSSESSDLTSMIENFESADEDAAWEQLDQGLQQLGQKQGYEEYQAVRIKIAFLAGCRHDIRGQFAVGADHDSKTACDFDRHAFMDANHARRNTNQLAIMVAGKASTGTPA